MKMFIATKNANVNSFIVLRACVVLLLWTNVMRVHCYIISSLFCSVSGCVHCTTACISYF